MANNLVFAGEGLSLAKYVAKILMWSARRGSYLLVGRMDYAATVSASAPRPVAVRRPQFLCSTVPGYKSTPTTTYHYTVVLLL